MCSTVPQKHQQFAPPAVSAQANRFYGRNAPQGGTSFWVFLIVPPALIPGRGFSEKLKCKLKTLADWPNFKQRKTAPLSRIHACPAAVKFQPLKFPQGKTCWSQKARCIAPFALCIRC